MKFYCVTIQLKPFQQYVFMVHRVLAFLFLKFFSFLEIVVKFDSQVTTGIEMVKTLRTSSSDVVL